MNAKFYSTMEFVDWLSLLSEIQELKECIKDKENEIIGLQEQLSK